MTSPDQLAEYYNAALQWARERGYKRDRLPAGWAGCSRDCPLANAVGGSIFGGRWFPRLSGDTREHLPFSVKTFVDLFDGEQYAAVEGYEDLDPSYDAARELEAGIEARS